MIARDISPAAHRGALVPARRMGALGWLCAVALINRDAWAGPPYLTDDPEPVEYRHWEVYAFSMATRARDDLSGVLPGIEVNYGAAPNVQLHVILPTAFDQTTHQGTRFGYGDTELGIKYRFVKEDPDGLRPQVGIFPLVELPTGSANQGLGSGHTRVFLPVWVQKSFGNWTTYGGGGYWSNPGIGNRDNWFFGWLLQRKITDRLTLGGELFHQTADTLNARSSTGFNVGGSYDFTEKYHLLFSSGRGLSNAETSNRWSYYVAFQWTF